MAQTMTDEEWHAFVSEGTRTGKLSTVRPDGRPHVAPVWFVLDGGDLVLTTGKNSVKGRNMAHDDRVAICVDDQRPPFSFAVLQGRAELSEDLDEMLRWTTAIAARYVGADKAKAFGERNAGPGELLVRVRVDRVVAMSGLAG
ncbi:PPOX class F420-dependent oxidoreductase [Streptomyces pathocidini]|uniref:PPOX class F420-dependent oxidoreductase n=1 Tax=Streptomyces pathocidini TaxID=1650571 RepID=A0ABW7UPL7_9ACTN|nr:PPOX class F420-dependent oxidoreductase [Streptomyces pathocidini]